MTLVHLLINPAAGAGTAGLRADQVAEILEDSGFAVRTVVSRHLDHAVDVAAQVSPDDVVATLGGDGMLSLVARGLIRSGATMLPLPAGRGNDFIRALNLPRDSAAVAHGLKQAMTDSERYIRKIDVGMVNGIPFLGVLSLGFDAEANTLANRWQRFRSPLIYTAAGVRAIATVQRRGYELRGDTGQQSYRAWSLAVGNSGRHGGGQQVCPDADLTDGLLDVVAFGGNRFQFAASALAMRSGKHVRLPHVHTFRTRTLTIESVDAKPEDPSPSQPLIYADGEPVNELPLNVTVEPAALRVVIPPTSF